MNMKEMGRRSVSRCSDDLKEVIWTDFGRLILQLRAKVKRIFSFEGIIAGVEMWQIVFSENDCT